MKAILIAIKPPHMANILNGDKNVEVRTSKALANAAKKMIAEQGYAQFLAYCSKDNKDYLVEEKQYRDYSKIEYILETKKEVKGVNKNRILNGKVVCGFKCYKVEDVFTEIIPKLERAIADDEKYKFPQKTQLTEDLLATEFLKLSCLTIDDLEDYFTKWEYDELFGDTLKVSNGYAIHISDLNIFDKPKELSEFEHEIMIRDTIRGISYDIVPVHRVNDWLWVIC